MTLRVLLFITLIFAFPAHAARVVPQSFTDVQLSYAPLVSRVAPAVVNVYTRKVVTERVRSPLLADPFWQRFLGNQFPGSGLGRERKRVQNSLGSGVIVSDTGLVVTNHHVIDGADEITIALNDRREFEAEILLSDERTDLAILKLNIRGADLPHLTLAESDALLVGDTVMAIGNPFGVGQSVSVGIVSALARTQVSDSDAGYFIQTDAAINPGNSGGALVDMTGALVGINTAIFTRSGGSNGIGFAIPANMVRAFLRVAQSEDRVLRRPWVGASGQVVTAEIADGLGLDRPRGILINSVVPGSPADRAGIRDGDILISVDGQDVFDVPSMNFRLLTRGIGARAEVGLLRRGRERTVTISLEVAPEDPPRTITTLEENTPLVGITIANLSPAFNEELGLDGSEQGVIVLEVPGRSYARRLGVRVGDRILAINGRPVTRVRNVEALLLSVGNEWAIDLSDGRKRRTLRVRR